MNHSDLERWAERTAQQLQETADAAEESGSDATPELALIAEYEAILSDRPLWQVALQFGPRNLAE